MTDQEIRSIPDFFGYGVTRTGKVYSRRLSEEWREIRAFSKGKGGPYLKVKLYTARGEYVQKPVHELVLIAWKGPKPKSPDGYRIEANHKDFNTLNNDADNLEWVTQLENVIHAVAGGRIPMPKPITPEQWEARRLLQNERDRNRRRAKRKASGLPLGVNHVRGERAKNARLTEADVREIRALHSRFSLRKLSLLYGVTPNTIYRIVRREKWKHVI